MLFRKMLRDIRDNLGSYLACIAIIAIGLLTFVSMANVRDILVGAKDTYYGDTRFADVFAEVSGIPVGDLDKLERIAGIAAVDARLVRDVRVLPPDNANNVSLRLVSMDLDNPERLNDFWLKEGTLLRPDSRSILLGIEFYDQNGFQSGDDITLIIHGRRETLSVAGKGQTPDYVYTMKSATDFLPAGETFGAAYLDLGTMESLFQTREMRTHLSFSLEADTEFDDVKEALRTTLEPYGMTLLVAQKDQMSNFMLTEEIKQLENFATSAPLLFLSVSTILLWIMLKRMVEHQRTQIGVLKAAGHTRGEVLRHYLSFALFVGVLGGVAGCGLGFALSGYMMEMYSDFFSLPGLVNRFTPVYLFIGMALSVGFSLLAGFLGARTILSLPPAVALAPPAPHSAHRIGLEKLSVLWKQLTVQGRMAMRNLFRNKGRSLFTLFGISMSFSLMASIFSFTDLFDVFILDQFRYVQQYDMKVVLERPAPRREVVAELGRRAEVQMAEPLLEVPVTLRHQHREKGVVVIATAPDATLYTVVDKQKRPVPLPSEGMLLSETLAEQLEVGIGDVLLLESPLTSREDLRVSVTGLVPQYIGMNAYMQQDTLLDLLGHLPMATSVMLRVPEEHRDTLRQALLDGENIAAVEDIRQTLNGYVLLLDQFFYMIWVMVAMVILVGFAIVYNSSIISLSERERELASLRVLGMDLHEVQEVISFEQHVLAVAGMLLGIPLTYGMYKMMADGMKTDIYTIPLIINPSMFFHATLGTVGSLLLAWLNIRRRLHKLDMVEVLKARE